ncbi:MAG: hypothetical protein ACI3XA_08020 [Clostridia bacterium]
MNNTKKVIILENLDSSLIAQAIFILKDEMVNEFSALEEAERIVREYTFFKAKKHSKIPYVLCAVAVLLIFTSLYIAFL